MAFEPSVYNGYYGALHNLSEGIGDLGSGAGQWLEKKNQETKARKAALGMADIYLEQGIITEAQHADLLNSDSKTIKSRIEAVVAGQHFKQWKEDNQRKRDQEDAFKRWMAEWAKGGGSPLPPPGSPPPMAPEADPGSPMRPMPLPEPGFPLPQPPGGGEPSNTQLQSFLPQGGGGGGDMMANVMRATQVSPNGLDPHMISAIASLSHAEQLRRGSIGQGNGHWEVHPKTGRVFWVTERGSYPAGTDQSIANQMPPAAKVSDPTRVQATRAAGEYKFRSQYNQWDARRAELEAEIDRATEKSEPGKLYGRNITQKGDPVQLKLTQRQLENHLKIKPKRKDYGLPEDEATPYDETEETGAPDEPAQPAEELSYEDFVKSPFFKKK